ncbi:hypothetical protein V8C34DRAFT_281079, partial [Trichoderma compactum]
KHPTSISHNLPCCLLLPAASHHSAWHRLASPSPPSGQLRFLVVKVLTCPCSRRPGATGPDARHDWAGRPCRAPSRS